MGMKWIRVMAAVCAAAMVWAGTLGQAAAATTGSDTKATITGHNDYVQYTVKAANGRFSIRNVAGDPSRTTDNDAPLLYNGKEPETSFATFRINGQDYIYGNNYGFLNLGGAFTQAPQSVGGVNTSEWQIGAVKIQQTLEIVDDANDPNVGNVRVSYKVTNGSDQPKQIGTRLLLDTMLGTNDGPSFWAGGSAQATTHETELTGSAVPDYWRSVDNAFNPSVFSYGLLGGWGNAKPDTLVFGHWNKLAETKWDYAPDSSLDFTSVNNTYGSADSAVALYWNPAAIPAGGSRTFETYYGAGNLVQASADSSFKVQTFAPEQMKVNAAGDGYENQEFVISAEVDNTLADAADLTNVNAALILEDGLKVADGGSSYQTATAIRRNGTYTFTWKVKATPQQMYAVKQYRVDIKADGMQSSVTGGGFVLLPGVQGDPPDLQFQQLGPNTVYNDGTRYLSIKGQGFDLLKDKSRWTLSLNNTVTGTSVRIPADNIVVSDDTDMLVRIEGEDDPGNYQLTLQHKDFGIQHIQQTFQMSDDPKYIGRYYGLLAITKSTTDDDTVYNIVSLQSEKDLQAYKDQLPDDESVLMEIRGDVTEKQDGSGQTEYVINTDANPAVFNSVVTYKGAPMTIVKKPADSQHIRDYVSVTGKGSLHVSGGMEFWNDTFGIELKDGVDYALNADDDQEPVTIDLSGLQVASKMISGFAIQIHGAILQDKAVSFSGEMAIALSPNEKEKKPGSGSSGQPEEGEDEENENGFSASIDNILYGEKDDGAVGFQGINATAQVKLPEGALGNLLGNGTGATLTIDTIDQIYSLDLELSLEVLEFHGLLTIAIQDGSPAIDDLFISGGGEPGIPVAPELFLTKVGGGVEDISASSDGPGKIVLEAALKMAGVLEGDFTLKASKVGASLSGELDIEDIPFLKEVSADLQWGDPAHLELSASLNIVDVIIGEVYIYISGDEFQGYAKAAIQFPTRIPFVGGSHIAGAELGVSSDSVWGSIELIGIPFGIRYYWGEGVEFSNGLAMAGGPAGANAMYAATLKDKNGKPVRLEAGTNLTRMNRVYAILPKNETGSEVRIASFTGSLGDGSKDKVRAAASSQSGYVINVSDQDLALFEVSYSGDRKPTIAVTDPEGNDYELIQTGPDANYLEQTIPAGESSSGQEEHRIYVSVKEPKDGAWRLTSDLPVSVNGYDVAPAPQLGDVGISKVDDRHLQVTWSSKYADGAHVSLSLVQNETESGRLLAEGLDPASGEATIAVPADMPTGDYEVRVTLSDDQYGHQTAWTENVHLVDQEAPSAVTGVSAHAVGDGMLGVAWTPPSGDVSGYYVEVYDEQGNEIDTVGAQYVEGDRTEAVIGGQYTDQTTGQKMGLEPGRAYKIGVTAKRVTGDGASHLSPVTLSSAVDVPLPNPAKLTVAYGGEFQSAGTPDATRKLTNHNTVTLHFTADQNVTTTVKVNGEVRQTKTGADWTLTLPVTDGDYQINFDSVNGQGDTSTADAAFSVDTTAPPLMIAPARPGKNGVTSVAGTTGQDAAVTIDGTRVTVDRDGHFAANVQIGNNWSKQVHIQATDPAGNKTEYDTELLNTNLKPITKVALEDYDKQMAPGESQSFKLEGFDQDGNPVTLDPNRVKWTILQGGAAATVTDEGLLQTNEPGDVVVLASYATTDDFAFQDAAVLTVKPDQSSTDPTGDDGDNGGGDTGGIGGGGTPPPKATGDDIDQELQNILTSIIAQNMHLKLVGQYGVVPGQAVTVPVGEKGGLALPKDLVKEKDAVAVSTVDEDPTADGGQLNPSAVQRSQMFNIQFAKLGDSLPEPVKLTLHYNASGVRDPKQLALYRYNPVFDKWQYVGADIDPVAHTITAQTDRLGTFVVLENPGLPVMADMDGRWSDQAVNALLSLGLVGGVANGDTTEFQPLRPVTRLEISKLIVEAMKQVRPLQEAGEPPFADWAGIPAWGKPYAQAAYANGWMTGTSRAGGIVFDAAAPLTRAEAATIIGRAIGQQAGAGTGTADFADAADIPAWASPYVGSLVADGILSGYPDGTFRPDAVLTREEAAALLLRWIDSDRFAED